MKKIITLFTACLLMSATVAAADPYWYEHHEHHEHHEQYRTITVAREHYNGYYSTQPVYSCTGWQLQYDRAGYQEYVRTCYEQ